MKISIIGLGYVGSVAAAGLAAAGHDVMGIDSDMNKVNAYRRGAVPIYEPGLAELIDAGIAERGLRFLHTEEVAEPLGDAVVVATGTPSGGTGGADLSQVRSALHWVKERERGCCVVVMKSTVPPGTGVHLLETALKDTSLQYVSNPEFLREGQAVSDWFRPDRIVIGGESSPSVLKVKELYRNIAAPCVITSITSAEMIKYAANAFLATKISFINEIAALCERVGATIDDVAQGIALDPRIGSSFLRAGVGYGGSCFPKDVDALGRTALTNGHSFGLLHAVIAVNNRQRLLPLQALRKRFGRLTGVKVGVLGLAFKPHTDDIRDAPAIELVHLLAEEGAVVSAYDPAATAGARKVLPSVVRLVESPMLCAESAQALVLMTEWPQIVEADWHEIARCMKHPRFLFDGRNALAPEQMQELGFDYQGVGRGAGIETKGLKQHESPESLAQVGVASD